MWKPTLASLVLATSLLACKDAPPQVIAMPAADVAKPGHMTVTGSALLEVSPDCADLTMTISADGARPGLATSAAQAKQQALVAALLKLGIEASEIKLSQLTLNPVYAPTPDGWSQLKVATYRAEITVTASTKRFDQIGAIMDAGAQSGATSMHSQFRRSDLPELKKKVREMALAATKEKAAQTAKVLSVQLGRIVEVSEAPAGHMWRHDYFPQAAEGIASPTGPAITIGGSLQPLSLDVTLGFELGGTV